MVECLLVKSFVETLDKINDKVGSLATDKIIDLIHQEYFNLLVLRDMVKISGNL